MNPDFRSAELKKLANRSIPDALRTNRAARAKAATDASKAVAQIEKVMARRYFEGSRFDG